VSAEEHEEIPWSMLVDHDRRTRSRFWYALAAVIIAAVGGVSAIRWVEGRRHGEMPAVVAPTVTTAAPTTTTTSLATEAGLLVADPVDDRMAAIATAEWFVTDYFTRDGVALPDLADLLAADAPVPDVPEYTAGGPVSFVEWARATATRPCPNGLVVTVLFRTLYPNQDGRIERSAVHAVDVIVLTGDDATAVADLPMPAPLPVHDIAGWAHTEGEAPPGVEAVALERAAELGANPVIESSGAFEDGWRVVVTVTDPSGARFPVAVRSGGEPSGGP
jgi:hypothetical protein